MAETFKKPLKVLSLFDGISCGMLALERAGMPVDRYVAYEIDPYAIKISQKNYPQIKQCGNVINADFKQYKDFDLIIGGSPCTYWSVANNNREVTPDGLGGKLFMEYVRALKESKCTYFLYENNYSIHRNIKEYISQMLGVKPILIDSATVSAQSRKRLYWTNIPQTEIKHLNIFLDDIIDSGSAAKEKAYCLTHIQGNTRDFFKKRQSNIIFEPIRIGTIEHSGNQKYDSQPYRVYSIKGKAVSIKANGGGIGAKTGLYLTPVPYGFCDKGKIYNIKGQKIETKFGVFDINLDDGQYIIRKLSVIESERCQTLPDDYTSGVSDTQRCKCIGNGWTVDVISHILGGLKNENY